MKNLIELQLLKKWLDNRLKERTSYDGLVLIGAGVLFLILKPIADIIAYGAIAYGAWTFYKKES